MINDNALAYRHCLHVFFYNQHYGGAILIIRNPYDASIAEWNRLSSGHTGSIADKNKFGKLYNNYTRISAACFLINIIII